MTEPRPVDGAGGALDGGALGVGAPRGRTGGARGAGAYAGAGLPDALRLLARLTEERRHTPLHAELDDVDEPLRLGDPTFPRPPARYIGDAATLVRLYAGRPLEGVSYELAGAEGEAAEHPSGDPARPVTKQVRQAGEWQRRTVG